MIPVNTLIDKINNLITSGSISERQAIDLSKAVDTIEKKGLSSVKSISELSASDNSGRIVFSEQDNRYFISNGVNWSGFDFSVIDPNINLYAWGFNGNGEVGDDTIIQRSSPVSVVGGFTDWISVSAGGAHSLSVRANGTLWAWGFNGEGRLGDNTTTSRRSPVSVVGGFTDWISASGSNHSLGLRANGTLWAWGNNLNGRLGDDTVTQRSSPVSVVGGFTDWIQASAGNGHSLGVRANGTVWAWGQNNNSRLGDDSTTSRSSPVSVVGGFTDWISASAGGDHSLGVRANGTLWAWGSNLNGRLGDNTVSFSRSSPVSVVGGFTDWISASAGREHSLGVRANGTLWAWGLNSFGQLGDNSTATRSSPVSVVGGFIDWVQASAGDYHSLGVRANGTVWAWGNNGNGRLGDDTVTQRSSPVSIVSGFTDWIQASAGGSGSLGVRA
jgi:alpha-tubulin suppressor-like RCC1 family protein